MEDSAYEQPIKSGHLRVSLLCAVAVGLAVASMVCRIRRRATAASSPRAVKASHPLKKGLKVFVIPKNLGNAYFTTADSAKSGGAICRFEPAGVRSAPRPAGPLALPSAQIPAIAAAISKGGQHTPRFGHRPGRGLSDRSRVPHG